MYPFSRLYYNKNINPNNLLSFMSTSVKFCVKKAGQVYTGKLTQVTNEITLKLTYDNYQVLNKDLHNLIKQQMLIVKEIFPEAEVKGTISGDQHETDYHICKVTGDTVNFGSDGGGMF